MNSLATVKPATLDLHWGIARAGTQREHNSVVVTAKGAPFTTGIVLDAWRHSGRLYVGFRGDRSLSVEGRPDRLPVRRSLAS